MGAPRARLLTVLQVAAFFICLPSWFATLASLDAKRRSEAQAEVRQPIPESWKWVVVNHGTAYHWPYHGKIVLFAGGWFLSLLFLVFSGLYAEGWRFSRRGDVEATPPLPPEPGGKGPGAA